MAMGQTEGSTEGQEVFWEAVLMLATNLYRSMIAE